MACTKEEIERKRLAALQKRQNKQLGSNETSNSPIKYSSGSPRCLENRKFEPTKSYQLNSNRSHPYTKPTASGSDNKVPIGKVVSGTVYLISEDRFEVNPSEFCTPLINVFKSMPTKCFG